MTSRIRQPVDSIFLSLLVYTESSRNQLEEMWGRHENAVQQDGGCCKSKPEESSGDKTKNQGDL